MKQILSIIILLLTLASTNANAWFFFFLPGNATGAIADAITGDKGENCVGPNTKVGDTVRLPDGSYGTIKSLSGTSSRCTSKLPVRALIEGTNSSSSGTPQPTALAPSTNKASIGPPTPVTQILLPDGTWGEPSSPPVLPDGSWANEVTPSVDNSSLSAVDTPAPLVSSDKSPSTGSSPSQSASPAQKLRELNALFKEGLIDKKEYAEKKRKILDEM
jgi:hypothetical protein